VAERFLDAHYVKIDLGAAEALTGGVAGKKLADERRLVGESAIDESTRQPNVYYRFVEERPAGDDRSHLIYRATFAVEGADTFDRRILLVLQRSDGSWKVVNFEEFE
ncbi:MAG: hypothetical protein ACREQJ_10705, partial [Candidatus Binatia bacterium]